MAFEAAQGISLACSAEIVQGRFVEMGAAGQIATMDGTVALADAIGVSLEATRTATTVPIFVAGDLISVATYNGGKVEVEAGAAITAGDAVQADATGRAITDGAAVSDRILGYAETAAGGAGTFVTVVLTKAGGVSVNAT